MRKIWDLVRCDPQLTLFITIWLGMSYVVHEDTKNKLDLWIMIGVYPFAGYLYFLIIVKVIRPCFAWSNPKIKYSLESLFQVKLD